MKLVVNNTNEFKINTINKKIDGSLVVMISDTSNEKQLKAALLGQEITALKAIRERENEDNIEVDLSEYKEVVRLDRRITDDVDTISLEMKEKNE